MVRDDTDGARRLPRGFWSFAAVLCAVSLVVLLGAFVVHRSDRGIEFGVFDWVHVVIAPEDEFVDVTKMLRDEEGADTDKAVDALRNAGFHRLDGSHPVDGRAETALREKGFHHIGSKGLIEAMRDFDVKTFNSRDSEQAAKDAARLRGALLEMMGRLEGPFELPGTLSGATADFIGALEELDDALQERREVSDLMRAIWEKRLEYAKPFGSVWLRADLEVWPDGEGADGRALACPLNKWLKGRYIQLLTGDGSVEILAQHDPRAFPCNGREAPPSRSLLKGDPVRLAISETTARQLIAPDPAQQGPLPAAFEAELDLRPANLVSVVRLP